MSLISPAAFPQLRAGDQLSLDEFLLRWEAMPDVRWAELIDGIVYMPSPVSDIHGDFHARLAAWMVPYVAATPGCVFRPASTWLMRSNSAPQPDLALKILPEHGGQSRLEGKYAAGAPELAVEISHTTHVHDSDRKLRLYERSGVQEYIRVRPEKHQITWLALNDCKFQTLPEDADGLFRSKVFPGLWLSPKQLWASDFPGFSATIQQGIATQAHADFVKKLQNYLS